MENDLKLKIWAIITFALGVMGYVAENSPIIWELEEFDFLLGCIVSGIFGVINVPIVILFHWGEWEKLNSWFVLQFVSYISPLIYWYLLSVQERINRNSLKTNSKNTLGGAEEKNSKKKEEDYLVYKVLLVAVTLPLIIYFFGLFNGILIYAGICVVWGMYQQIKNE